MERRSFFRTMAAAAIACVLPPIRTAHARIRRLLPQVWRDGKKRWEHLVDPEPCRVHSTEAQVVCRVLTPAHAPRVSVRDWCYHPERREEMRTLFWNPEELATASAAERAAFYAKQRKPPV